MDLDERIDRLSSVDLISSFAHQGWAVMTANQYNKVGREPKPTIARARLTLPTLMSPLHRSTTTSGLCGHTVCNQPTLPHLPTLPASLTLVSDDWSPDDFWDCYNKTNNDRHFCLKRREVTAPNAYSPSP